MAAEKKLQVAVSQLAAALSAVQQAHQELPADPLLTAEEVAAIFGCHTTTVHRLANKGLLAYIPFGHNGRGKRFRKSIILKEASAEAPAAPKAKKGGS